MSHRGRQRLALLSRASIGALVAVFVVLPVLIGQAASPTNIISYQGRLLDSNSSPVSASSAEMIFELYDAVSGGTCVWSNSSASCATATAQTVTLTDGLFSENLGDTGASPAYAAIGDSIFADNATLYLQVTVEGEALSPRKLLTAAPYALNAQTLDGLDSLDLLSASGDTGTGSYDWTGAVFAGANALVFEGSTADDNETTFTFTDPTADNTITFQDGTGTVAFTSDITGSGWTDDGTLVRLTTATDNVTVGSATDLSAALAVDGNANETQLLVQGNSTQTGPLFRLETSAGTGLFAVSGSGRVNLIPLSRSGSPSTNGAWLGQTSATYTDSATASSGTATAHYFNAFMTPTLAATNSSVTTTDAATFYIEAAPAAGTNQTITNAWALWIDGGDTRLDGGLTLAGAASLNGAVTLGDNLADVITVTGALAGSQALNFEGATADDFETNFTFTDPTADNTITFQDGSGTVAFTSDIGSSLWETGGNGTYEDGAAVIVGSDAAFTYVGSAGASDLQVGDDFEALDDGFFGGDLVVGASTASTESLANTGFVMGGDDLFVAGMAGVEGNIYTDTGLVIGATTTFTDGDIESSGALAINDSNNQAITTGTGLFTTGGALTATGALTANGNVTLGDNLADVITVTGALAGSQALNFEGATADDFETNFTFTDPTADNTITFQDGSGTVAFTSDIGSSLWETGGNGTYEDGAAVIVGSDAAFTYVGSAGASDLQVGDDFEALDDGFFGGDLVVGASTASTESLANTGFVVGGDDLFVAGMAGIEGNIYTDTGLVIGATTTFTDGDIESSGALTINNSNNQAITTGSGLFTTGGNLTVSGTALTLAGNGTIIDMTGTGTLGLNTTTNRAISTGTGTFDIGGNAAAGSSASPSALNILTLAGTINCTADCTGIDVATTDSAGSNTAIGVRATATGGEDNFSGYFYGAPLVIGSSATEPDSDLFELAVDGGGGLYVAGSAEIGNDLWLKGGGLAVEQSSGSTDAYFQTGDETAYAGTTIKVGSTTGAEWTVYGAGASATTSLGNKSDLRWAVGVSTDRGGDDEMRLTTTGDLFVDTATNNGGADVAEVYQVADLSLGAGDVVSLTASGDLVAGSSSHALFGVVSTRPGVVLNNGANDTFDADERWIALSGKVPTKVNLEGGTIAAGDPITVSSVAGEAKKATGPGMIVGFALEDYTGTESPIEVFVNLQWNPGGKISMDGSAVAIESDLIVNPLAEATASITTVDSQSLVLRGSAFDLSAIDRDIALTNVVTSATDYRLSIRNAVDAEIAYVDQDGAFSVAGDVIVGDHLYPSDRGTPQTNRYIFYDGSTGAGGDFMRTNAAGWATGSYDFAEMFPSSQDLEAGDVVVFAKEKESVERSTEASSSRIAGVVSTRPGFLAGENKAGHYPIALAGRVPTKVSNEGGEISVGDPLTTSSTTGVAMKATEAGMILGYALEDFSGSNGSIIAFINATYWNGQGTQPNNRASGLGASLGGLDLSGDVYIGANDILNVGTISGMNLKWEIAENGDFRTRGVVVTTIEAYNGDLVDTYATTSPEVYVTLAGEAELSGGRASVNLVKEDPGFMAVVSSQVPLRIVATPNAPIAVYVTNREKGSFEIRQLGGSSSGVMVDWYAVGVRKDFEKEEDLVLEEPGIPEEPDVEESDLTPKPPEEVEEVGEVTEVGEVAEAAEVGEVAEAAEVGEVTEVGEEEEVAEEEPAPEEEVVEDEETLDVLPSEVGEVVEDAEVGEVEEVIIEEEPAASQEEAPEAPASDVSPSPEPQQIPVESSHEDAGTVSEGATE